MAAESKEKIEWTTPVLEVADIAEETRGMLLADDEEFCASVQIPLAICMS